LIPRSDIFYSCYLLSLNSCLNSPSDKLELLRSVSLRLDSVEDDNLICFRVLGVRGRGAVLRLVEAAVIVADVVVHMQYLEVREVWMLALVLPNERQVY